MNITLTIPDDIYEVVQSEAAKSGMTPVARIERMVEIAHRFRIGRTREQMAAEYDHAWRVLRVAASGNGDIVTPLK